MQKFVQRVNRSLLSADCSERYSGRRFWWRDWFGRVTLRVRLRDHRKVRAEALQGRLEQTLADRVWNIRFGGRPEIRGRSSTSDPGIKGRNWRAAIRFAIRRKIWNDMECLSRYVFKTFYSIYSCSIFVMPCISIRVLKFSILMICHRPVFNVCPKSQTNISASFESNLGHLFRKKMEHLMGCDY